jgi:hypothetical protein
MNEREKGFYYFINSWKILKKKKGKFEVAQGKKSGRCAPSRFKSPPLKTFYSGASSFFFFFPFFLSFLLFLNFPPKKAPPSLSCVIFLAEGGRKQGKERRNNNYLNQKTESSWEGELAQRNRYSAYRDDDMYNSSQNSCQAGSSNLSLRGPLFCCC